MFFTKTTPEKKRQQVIYGDDLHQRRKNQDLYCTYTNSINKV